MYNYPERYYELLEERDTLKKEKDLLNMLGLNDALNLIDMQIYLTEIETEIEQIKKEHTPKEFYMITKETYYKRFDDEEYVTVGEFFDEETALLVFKEEFESLVEEFDENYAVKEDLGFAAVEDENVLKMLFLIKIEIDEEI